MRLDSIRGFVILDAHRLIGVRIGRREECVGILLKSFDDVIERSHDLRTVLRLAYVGKPSGL